MIKAISLSPNFAAAYINLAYYYAKVNKFEEAKANLEKALSLNELPENEGNKDYVKEIEAQVRELIKGK